MDQSVARKFVMVMSMFIAVFATVFVCGTVVNDSAVESYRRPIPKSDSTVYRQDEIAYTSFSDIAESNVTPSDASAPESEDRSAATGTDGDGSDEIYRTVYEPETTRQFDVTFYSRPDPEGEAARSEYESIEEQFLYMTTVTTTGTVRQKKTTTQALRPAASETTTWRRQDAPAATRIPTTASAAKPAAVTTAPKPLPTSSATAAVKPSSSVTTQKPASDTVTKPSDAGTTVDTTTAPSDTERSTFTTSASGLSDSTTVTTKATASSVTEPVQPTTAPARVTAESTTMTTIATGVFYPDDDEIAVG